jgi:hypothetical protein
MLVLVTTCDVTIITELKPFFIILKISIYIPLYVAETKTRSYYCTKTK